eukprot:6055171-Pyramimonas_sp.AAC.1
MQDVGDWDFGVGEHIPSGSTPDSDPPQSIDQLYFGDPWRIRPDSSDQVSSEIQLCRTRSARLNAEREKQQ